MLLSPDTLVLDSSVVAIQDTTHVLDKYARLQLSDNQKGIVLFHKLEGQSGISDTQHDLSKPWVVQCTAIEEGDLAYHNTATMNTETGEAKAGAFSDDGFIFTFYGRPVGTVAVDHSSHRILPESEARLMEQTFAYQLPRYTKWDFRIHEIIATDGPQARVRAMESNEQARARSEERMMNKQEEFFGRLIQMITSKGGEGVVSVAEIQKAIQDAPVNLTPAQVAARKEMSEIEAEHEREKQRGNFRSEPVKASVVSQEALSTLRPVQVPDPMKKR